MFVPWSVICPGLHPRIRITRDDNLVTAGITAAIVPELLCTGITCEYGKLLTKRYVIEARLCCV